MSAPPDVCQCGHEKKNHWPILLGGRNHCSTCGCKKFTARGLPPESQGEEFTTERQNTKGRSTAPEVEPATSTDGGSVIPSPTPQPAEPCAQGTGLASIVALGCPKESRAVCESMIQRALDQAAAAKDARIAELEAEKARLSRDERIAVNVSKKAHAALQEAEARLAASETDRERLRAALEECDPENLTGRNCTCYENPEGPCDYCDAARRMSRARDEALAPALATEGTTSPDPKIESAFRRGFRYGRLPNTFEAEAWINYQNDPTK